MSKTKYKEMMLRAERHAAKAKEWCEKAACLMLQEKGVDPQLVVPTYSESAGECMCEFHVKGIGFAVIPQRVAESKTRAEIAEYLTSVCANGAKITPTQIAKC